MRTKTVLAVAAAALLVAPVGPMSVAQAAQSSTDTTTYNPQPTVVAQPMNCRGETGDHGCGPGWIWNGYRCVPC
jgi:hypothetical protein